MGSSAEILASPYFWGLWFAVGLGGAAAWVTVVPGRTRRPGQTRRIKPIAVCLFLSLAAASAAAGLIRLQSLAFVDSQWLSFFSMSVAFCAIGFRFFRSVGLALGLGFFVLQLSVAVVFHGWTPVGETLARLTVVGERTAVLAADRGGEHILDSEDGSFRVEVDYLRMHGLYVFSGRSVCARVRVPGGDGFLWRLFLRLPGMEHEVVNVSLQAPRLFGSYELRVDQDGLLSFFPLSWSYPSRGDARHQR